MTKDELIYVIYNHLKPYTPLVHDLIIEPSKTPLYLKTVIFKSHLVIYTYVDRDGVRVQVNSPYTPPIYHISLDISDPNLLASLVIVYQKAMRTAVNAR